MQLIFQFRFLVGAGLSVGGWSAFTAGGTAGTFAWGAASWLLITFAVYLGNGVADVVEDRLNGSVRPIAVGRVDPRLAARVTALCFVLGVALAALNHPVLGMLAAGLALLGVGYSFGPYPFKRSSAATTAVVVVAGLLTYLAGGVATGGRPLSDGRAACFAILMSAWMAVGGLAKDLSDVDGDRAAGRRTLAVRLGIPVASALVAVAALTVALGALAAATRYASLWPVAVVTAAGAGWIAVQVRTSRSSARPVLRRPYIAFMSTQYMTHLTAMAVLWG